MNIKTIPLWLKIVSILSILWIIWAMFAIPMRYEQGIPFFWLDLIWILAITVVLFLDIIWPLIFLIWVLRKYILWARIAYLYISIFILNSIIAIFTEWSELGVIPILIPAVVYGIFWIIIFKNRKYFK